MDGINKESGGPQPDKLGVKFSGNLPADMDLRRTQVMRIEVEGMVVGHNFVDHYDKDGDRTDTIKVAVIKVDELVSLQPIVRPRRSTVPGQQSFEDVQGEATGEPEANGAGRIDDAEVVGELEAGEPPAEIEEEDPDLEWR